MLIERGILNCRIIRCTDEERRFVADYLRFPKKTFRGQQGDAFIDMFSHITMSFPSGFFTMLEKVAKEEDMPFEVVDTRKRPVEFDPGADLAWLRSYQREAVDAVREKSVGILRLSTGAGKTEIAVATVRAHPCRWLFVVHRSTLAGQAADRYNLRNQEHGLDVPPAGLVFDGRFTPSDRFTCATFQTLIAGLKMDDPRTIELIRNTQGVIFDECFPAGTMVGNKRIEDIRVGDTVPSFNERTREIVHKRVTSIMQKQATSLVRVTTANGASIVCTPNHPFLTTDGWVTADSLIGKEIFYNDVAARTTVWSVPKTDFTNSNYNKLRRILRAMQTRKESTKKAPTKYGGHASVCRVRKDGGHDWSKIRQETPTVLRQDLPIQISIKDNVRYSAVASNKHIKTHDGAKPDAVGNDAHQSKPSATRHKSQADNSGRQRSCTAYSTSADVGGTVRGIVYVGGRTPHPDTRGLQAPVFDSGRHRGSEQKGSSRNRRQIPLHIGCEGSRRAKDNFLERTRVESVTVLEQDDSGGFGSVCPDGVVYNLSVEETHTYIANGMAVHNCHTIAADSFFRLSRSLSNAYYRIGLSGTPLDRGDKRSLLAVATVGPIIYTLKTESLINAGVLAKPKIIMVDVKHVPSAKSMSRATYAKVYSEAIVRAPIRNATIVEAVKRAEKPCLVFVRDIDHGRNLVKLLERQGISADFAWGNVSTLVREKQIRDITSGRKEVLIASVVHQEGTDIPALRSVVISSAGRSIIATLQRIGRGMRRSDGKDSFTVYDICDVGCGCDRAAKALGTPGIGLHSACKWLTAHSNARQRSYLREKHTLVHETWPVTVDG